MDRIAKQIIIALIVLALLSGVGFGIYYFSSARPTCDDGVQNGKEEGIDCGLIACGVACINILPLRVTVSKLLPAGQNDYDFVFQVNNPSPGYGTPFAEYELSLIGASGSEIDKIKGSFYILPGQTKYVALSFKMAEEISAVNVKVSSVDWQKLTLGGETQFILKRQQYRNLVNMSGATSEEDLIFEQELLSEEPISEGLDIEPSAAGAQTIYSEFDGILFNNSDFDFDRVDVAVVLFDDSDNIVGINRTTINRFLSQTDRYFRTRWPFEIDESVFRADVEATTNLFENENFIRTHGGSQEKFQKYY
ncbi:MAG: hypothetical protein A3J01_02585 [Candidatus Yanofskybacteria bacterium RIFCSPLOWO2_02_FULL_45_18]|uniref:Uncharacterized protein n=1 Tax=Candidatus Yanofskybacteria bacterium RIFCSPLOWO2_02_FULL_45_18 TaxID=1802707 RepID=A0A1F8H4K6_9BACT|nr:MAG: hypothetical protein A3J01_02585 [Candidatus Yanofskybacteria bacterium RIFCSPLOWO2_02_FULL_45_18]